MLGLGVAWRCHKTAETTLRAGEARRAKVAEASARTRNASKEERRGSGGHGSGTSMQSSPVWDGAVRAAGRALGEEQCTQGIPCYKEWYNLWGLILWE